MRKLLLMLVWFTSALPLAHAQWMAGLSLVNTAIWPQPDLRVPIPSTGTDVVQQEKREPPLLAPAGTAAQANARALAANFPAEQRVNVEQAFRQSFDTYGQLTKKLDIPQRDMAASLAAFIVGTYMAMNEADVPDDVFKAVARQLRQAAHRQGRHAAGGVIMTKFLISFPAGAMDVPAEDMPAVSDASHAVIREAKAAGVSELDGGFCVLELPSREAAVQWAAKLAAVCRCPQELREFYFDPES